MHEFLVKIEIVHAYADQYFEKTSWSFIKPIFQHSSH